SKLEVRKFESVPPTLENLFMRHYERKTFERRGKKMKKRYASWHILFIHYLKRDWKKIMLGILGDRLFSAAFVPAYNEITKGNGIQAMFETLQNPAMTSMLGPTPVESANNYTVGAMYAHEMLLFCGLLAMILTALHVISHTRKEEELGLTELIR